MKLTRQSGFYIIRLFMPSAMLVCLSWIAFYISPYEVGDRLAIGITLIFLLGYVDASLPKVSYIKAIDWYLIVALFTIIASVMETVFVYWYVHGSPNPDEVNMFFTNLVPKYCCLFFKTYKNETKALRTRRSFDSLIKKFRICYYVNIHNACSNTSQGLDVKIEGVLYRGMD